MLLRIGIHNFALIEQMNIDFSGGITIFTGETGAGKSILMDAFSILLGERASSEFIRQGKDSFLIEGLFDITGNTELLTLLGDRNILVEEGNQLILSRSFSRQGKTSILANDQPITLRTLREIGSHLADIHGQYSNQLLLDEKNHRHYLDHINKEGREAFSAYTAAYKAYVSIRREIEELAEKTAERARELDTLRFQIDEIEEAALQKGEDVQIAEELQRLDNFEHMNKVLTACSDAFYNDRSALLESFNNLRTEIKDLIRYDKAIGNIAELADSAYFQMEEAASQLERYHDSISYDEERYAWCQQRDSLLYSLKKKYGDSIEDILAYEDKAQARLEELETVTDRQEELEAQLALCQSEAVLRCQELTKVRDRNAAYITAEMEKTLAQLGMPKAKLQFAITPTSEPELLTPIGADSVELLFSANAGEEPMPLSKIASGGELSRIALAFKSLFTADSFKTLVFDEIDVGISGDVALQVAHQILQLGRDKQVFCITHLPQTASIADHHFHLEKLEKDGRTITTLRRLSEDEHVGQIALMMSGNSFSSTALQTARELIAHFRKGI